MHPIQGILGALFLNAQKLTLCLVLPGLITLLPNPRAIDCCQLLDVSTMPSVLLNRLTASCNPIEPPPLHLYNRLFHVAAHQSVVHGTNLIVMVEVISSTHVNESCRACSPAFLEPSLSWDVITLQLTYSYETVT